MAKAKCFRCGASAIGDTFEQARNKLNHSVGLSRGIKCGDSYGTVKEIKEKQLQPKTSVGTYYKVKGKSTENIQFDETKTEDSNPESTSEKVKEKKTKSKKEKYL